MAKPAFDPSKPFEAVKPAFNPSKPFEVVAEQEPSGLEQLETAARSGLESATLGISEPAISGINSVLGNLIDSGFEAESLKDFFSKSIDSARIESEYKKDIERRRALKEDAKSASIAGALIGGLAPTGPAAALGRGAKAAIGATKLAELGAAGRIAASAAESALAAGGSVAAEQAVEQATGVIPEGSGMSALEAAAFGAKLGGAGKAVVEAVKGARAVAPKVVSVLGGPKVEAIQKYLADPEAVKRAKSPEAIKELMDEAIAKLKADVESGKIKLDEAKEILGEAEQRVRDVSQARKADIADALKLAREDFKEAQAELLEPIKRAKPPATLASDIIDAADELKAKVSADSEESYKILDRLEQQAKAGAVPRVNLGDVPDFIKNLQSDLKVNGKLLSAEERAAFNALEKYRVQGAAVFRERVAYPTVKRIIQSIDRDIRTYGAPNSAQFSDLSREKLLQLRRGLDQIIKTTSPEYAAQMEKVAAGTELLNDVSKFLGREQKIQGKLEGIWRPAQASDKDLVIQLGKAVNKDFAGPINAYAQAKQLAQQPLAMEAMAKGLPQAKELAQAEAQMARLRRPGAEQILAPKEVRQVQQARVGVQRAQQFADEAKARLAEIGPFGREMSNYNAIRGAVAGRNPAYEQSLIALSKASGQDFVQMINDLRLAEAFAKDFTQGSRNVNFFSIIAGGLTAGATGSLTAGAVLAGLGAGVGKFMDKFGGVATQKVLDRYLQIQGMPTVKKLQGTLNDLPPAVRDFAIADFVRAVTQVKQETITVPAEQIPVVYQDIKSSDMDTVSKAKALEDLTQAGTVNSETMKKAMLGIKPPVIPVKVETKDTLKEDRPDVLKAMIER
jgi:hypothetical protein